MKHSVGNIASMEACEAACHADPTAFLGKQQLYISYDSYVNIHDYIVDLSGLGGIAPSVCCSFKVQFTESRSLATAGSVASTTSNLKRSKRSPASFLGPVAWAWSFRHHSTGRFTNDAWLPAKCWKGGMERSDIDMIRYSTAVWTSFLDPWISTSFLRLARQRRCAVTHSWICRDPSLRVCHDVLKTSV